MKSGDTDVAVVGAGPYGLSLAAFLRERGVDFRIFGRPMRSWLQMPEGMFLKSLGFATNIYTPIDGNHFTWKSVGREVDGQYLPNMEELKITRAGSEEEAKLAADEPSTEKKTAKTAEKAKKKKAKQSE